VVSGWTIFFSLLGAYMVFLVWLVRSGRLEKWNLGLLLGIILMMRTQRGRRALEIIARPKRFWNALGDVGTVVAFLGMAAMTFVMIALLPVVLSPRNAVQPLGASEILVIPGVNPFVPLWYGLIALVVTLVVHEGGHGILAMANKMRVKSLGLLFAIVPIGAFVEPDEDDMVQASRRNRLRVFAAGPTLNFVTWGVTLAIFAGMAGAATAIAGAPIATVTADAPAANGGILPGDILTGGDGTSFADWTGFTAFMQTKAPGDTVTFTLHEGGTRAVTLGDRWSRELNDAQRSHILNEEEGWQAMCARSGAADAQSGGECAEALQQSAFLGISTLRTDVPGVLSQPFSDGGRNFLLYAALPIGEVRGQPYLSGYLPDFHETPFDSSVYWPLLLLAFWVSWINLMVGLTNILPMLPLDGGHLFRDGVAGVLGRLRPKLAPERRDKIVGRLAGVVSFTILIAFLLQIFGPRIVQALA
jgi:membrane-associated protease RseP (regulator of RpoE activity)